VTKIGKDSETGRGMVKEIRTQPIPNPRKSPNPHYLNERIEMFESLEETRQLSVNTVSTSWKRNGRCRN
jgi:hypothetical protein